MKCPQALQGRNCKTRLAQSRRQPSRKARLTHLAYAPEIAQAMLRRQQAEAVIAARQKIVHGAVSMVGDGAERTGGRETGSATRR